MYLYNLHLRKKSIVTLYQFSHDICSFQKNKVDPLKVVWKPSWPTQSVLKIKWTPSELISNNSNEFKQNFEKLEYSNGRLLAVIFDASPSF